MKFTPSRDKMKTEILEIGRKQDQMEVKQDEIKVVFLEFNWRYNFQMKTHHFRPSFKNSGEQTILLYPGVSRDYMEHSLIYIVDWPKNIII